MLLHKDEIEKLLFLLVQMGSSDATLATELLKQIDVLRGLVLQEVNAPSRLQGQVPWIELANKYIGLTETVGAAHSKEILEFWKDIKRGGIKDDETPWCAAFVGAMLERSGIKSTRFESASSYLTWGVYLSEAAFGCVVVFSRDKGGHVGFVVGRHTNGKLMVLGGNQGNSVSVSLFDTNRVLGYRWPDDIALPTRPVPVMASSATASTSEA